MIHEHWYTSLMALEKHDFPMRLRFLCQFLTYEEKMAMAEAVALQNVDEFVSWFEGRKDELESASRKAYSAFACRLLCAGEVAVHNAQTKQQSLFQKLLYVLN